MSIRKLAPATMFGPDIAKNNWVRMLKVEVVPMEEAMPLPAEDQGFSAVLHVRGDSGSTLGREPGH